MWNQGAREVMNNSHIKATLIPYSEAPHLTMLPLQNWLSGFEFKTLNTQVAVASNEKGVIVSVCYMKIDDSFLITAMEINPKASVEEKTEASNGIDMLLEQHAQRAGVTKLYMVTGPRGNECKEITTYIPRVSHVKELQAPHAAYTIN
jgi:hypothetical protein